MPIYEDVQTIAYYPNPELTARQIFADLSLTSVLDVGAGHGGVFDLARWQDDPNVIRREACDIFWIRGMPDNWITRLDVDIHELDIHYQAGSFDFVQCCEVLEHVLNPRLALEQLIQVAKKAVFITSADEMHHMGIEQERLEQFNQHQAYRSQPKIQDLLDLGFEVRVEELDKRQIVAWLIK